MLVILFFIFFFSAIVTYFYRQIAMNANILDIPNSRSSHNVPKPRGGGVAIVLTFLMTLFLLHKYAQFDDALFFALSVGGLLIASVGFLDDIITVRKRWRLSFQCIAALLALFTLVNPIQFSFLHLLFYGVVFISLVWMQNLYNFMDGADGLAASEAILVSIAIVFFMTLNQGALAEPNVFWVCLVLCFSTLGFLIWNFPAAKIFMGDGGSSFLGYVFGVLILKSFVDGSVPIGCWIILLGVFLVDATVTLLTRVIRGENFFLPHKTHAFQHALVKLGTHKKLVKALFLINLFWLFPLALLAWNILPHEPYSITWMGFGLSAFALAPVFGLVFYLGAGAEAQSLYQSTKE